MDSYIGPAEVHSRSDGYLGSVHADVTWQEDTWSGILFTSPEAIEWMAKDLTLHIDGHPAAEIGIKNLSDSTSQTGQVEVYIQGLDRAPFWAARPREELLRELRRRGPMAGALGPGGEVPAWNPEVHRWIRNILRERDGLTDSEIKEALDAEQ